jgi:hypothetical protein
MVGETSLLVCVALMFTTQHYNAMAKVLHECRPSMDDSKYNYWYDRVYLPIVKLFEEDNPRFSTVSFCYAVATGETVRRRMKDEADNKG